MAVRQNQDRGRLHGSSRASALRDLVHRGPARHPL